MVAKNKLHTGSILLLLIGLTFSTHLSSQHFKRPNDLVETEEGTPLSEEI